MCHEGHDVDTQFHEDTIIVIKKGWIKHLKFCVIYAMSTVDSSFP